MHKIHFVDDATLSQDYLLMDTAEGCHIFYRESTLTPDVLESSWSAYRALIGFSDNPTPDPERCDLADAPAALVPRKAETLPRLLLVS